MNTLEDLPGGPQLRPDRAQADKTVVCAAVRRDKPTERTCPPQGLGVGLRLKNRPLARRAVITSVLSAAAVALIVALVATLVAQVPPSSQRSVASPGQPRRAAPTWRLVSDVSPSWRALPNSDVVPGGPKGQNFSCPSTTTCYATSFTPTGSGTTSEVEVTNDGGTTWRAMALPVTLSRPPSLACVDASTCALLGVVDGSGDSAFLETNDGGQTWSSHAGPNGLTAMNGPSELACTTATSCLVVTPGLNSKISSLNPGPSGGSAAYRTDDGGSTWATASLPTGFMPFALQCTAAATCVTSGSEFVAGAPATSRATILSTSDGGTTWVVAAVPSGLGAVGTFAPSILSCANSGNCIAVFSDIADSSTQVLTSTDGGATWAATTATGLEQAAIMSLSCPTATECWEAGVTSSPGTSKIDLGTAAGVVATTSDGGQTWQEAQLPPGVGAVLDISCPGENSCYALAVQANGDANASPQFVFLAYGTEVSG